MDRLMKILQRIKPDIGFLECSELVDEGLLDSMDIVEIVTAIEEEFSIEIPPESIDPDNFQSKESMWKMIEAIRNP